MGDPMDDLQSPLNAANPVSGRPTNLNLTKSGDSAQRKFSPPPRAQESEATRSGGSSGSGVGSFSQGEPTPLEVPDWLQEQQDVVNSAAEDPAGLRGEITQNMPLLPAPGMTPAEQAIWEVKQAMIAPHQAAIDAINANADVIIPLLTDLKQLQGVIAATEDKNVMIEAIKELMVKLSDSIGA
jgi:hypothetical protein